MAVAPAGRSPAPVPLGRLLPPNHPEFADRRTWRSSPLPAIEAIAHEGAEAGQRRRRARASVEAGAEKHPHSTRRRLHRLEPEMKIFSTKKSKDPPPTIQDAINQINKMGESVDEKIRKLDEELARLIQKVARSLTESLHLLEVRPVHSSLGDAPLSAS